MTRDAWIGLGAITVVLVVLISIGNGSPGGFVTIAVIAALYFLPTIIASNRHAAVQSTVTVINLLLGWTVVGWVVALAMAFGPIRPASDTAIDPHKWDPPQDKAKAEDLTLRQRIYEEEKLRAEIREQIERERAGRPTEEER